MIQASDSKQDYKIEKDTITVERVFSENKTIKEILMEYLLQSKDSFIRSS